MHGGEGAVGDHPPEGRRLVPAWLKWGYLAFVLALAPAYIWEYGLPNFLWFSNLALVLGLVAVWRESGWLARKQASSR